MSNPQHLLVMFGGVNGLSRATGIHRGLISRMMNGHRRILPHHQLIIFKAGKKMGMPTDELIFALGPERCPCCNSIIATELRQEVLSAA